MARHREEARGPCRVGVAHARARAVVDGIRADDVMIARYDRNEPCILYCASGAGTCRSERALTHVMVARPGRPGHEISDAPRAPAGHGSAVHGIIVVYLGW
jgi:hypothetical protein